MERLTSYKNECNREMICRHEDCCIDEEYCPHLNEDNCLCLQEVIKKLAEYEDLEEQGLLPKLPCKVGTRVYILRKDIKKIIGGEVIRFHIGEFMSTVYVFITDDNRYTEITFDNFGKTVFLTQAEAEEALEGMMKNEIQ